ncbi:hypothetical protein CEUSTIGMA_g4790.t1 [Chlamydomonas eustigma]|uniref:Uncharacterized protein n=1 Tax=Chlamydomonas eustigma TaxID=1157962 RepID=A0A250X2M1_9CHLO|nr:hypothetical protein CEUSTIGMA_g4790.t1 [Chlamydomonas eustigma]|eukprot:GAX77344.1 hypothetical protein CEUSTIGMA_g4790.t1 [Chlamydomonas eustigma]
MSSFSGSVRCCPTSLKMYTKVAFNCPCSSIQPDHNLHRKATCTVSSRCIFNHHNAGDFSFAIKLNLNRGRLSTMYALNGRDTPTFNADQSGPSLHNITMPQHAAASMLSTAFSSPRLGRPDGPTLVVFSGGTAFNVVAGRLRQFTDRVAYILPVSDDGGSTAEIVRVLGGPAVGDIRSRCLRLADDSDEEACAVKALLAHRLHPTDSIAAKLEWYTIVEGENEALWAGVSDAYKHVIRAFLVHFHSTILRHSTESFNFRNGSIGNFFFAGARTFFRSLEAAIFLFSRVARLPEGSLVLPAICTEERITLGAELEDGTVLRGQNQISHPPSTSSSGPHQVDKSIDYDLLESPIRHVFYLSNEGCGQEHEVSPKANPRVLTELQRADSIVYGMGSLYTSICPILCLEGIGESIATKQVPKILCLNGSHDRETASSGMREGPMTASDIVQAVTDALNRRWNRKGNRLQNKPDMYIDGLLVPRGGSILVDLEALASLGIQNVLEVDSVLDPESGGYLFEPSSLVIAIEQMINLINGGLRVMNLSPKPH